MQPGKLLLQAAGVCDFDPEHLLDVFGQQRQRFVAVLRGFGPDDWAAPTRCTDWSAHDVVRHLSRVSGLGGGGVAGPGVVADLFKPVLVWAGGGKSGLEELAAQPGEHVGG